MTDDTKTTPTPPSDATAAVERAVAQDASLERQFDAVIFLARELLTLQAQKDGLANSPEARTVLDLIGKIGRAAPGSHNAIKALFADEFMSAMPGLVKAARTLQLLDAMGVDVQADVIAQVRAVLHEEAGKPGRPMTDTI